MKLLKVILVLAGLIGFFTISSGCKKKNLEYTITGNIHDLSFNNSLQGAQVKIYSSGAGDDNFSTTITTGSDGSYSYTFPRKNYTDITIEVKKNNYFDQETTFIIDDLELDKDNVFDFNVEAKAWAKVHFISDGIKDIKFWRTEGYSGCAECCNGAEQTLYNVTDQEFLCLNKGNKPYKIYYTVIGSSTEHAEVQVITVPFEYTELLVDLQ